MATKKQQQKKEQPVHNWFTFNMDPEIRDALEAYLEIIKEKRNPFIQRLVREHLTEKGYWPPKGK